MDRCERCGNDALDLLVSFCEGVRLCPACLEEEGSSSRGALVSREEAAAWRAWLNQPGPTASGKDGLPLHR